LNARINFLRALRHPNYRLFFGGQSISLIGTWLTRVATSWLVYKLSGSAFILGVVGFAGQIPTFIGAPVAGVLVDRWNRHRVLVITQVLAMIQSALLAYFTLRGTITVGGIIALSVFQGLINAFDMPGRQAFVVDMLEDRADLPNAIALNSSMVNLARMIGPSLAGVLIATLGEGGCFAVDAVSYIAVVASLLMMKLRPPEERASRNPKVWGQLREGFQYVWDSVPIRSILMLLALVSLMGMPYMVLLPMVVKERLHGDAGTLGILTAATGVGALIGAFYLASRKSVLGLGRLIFIACAVFSCGLIAFAESRTLWLSLPMLVLTGMGMMVQMASSNTILQTLVDEKKRGRVMSFYTMAFTGMLPFGALLGGLLADRIGAPGTFLLGGLCCLAGGLAYLRALPRIRAEVRPVYIRLGLITPEPL
jgi:MFS family permease